MTVAEDLATRYAFRDRLVDQLVRDLVGPNSDDEVLQERPLSRYIAGVLWPATGTDRTDVVEDTEAGSEGPGQGAADVPVAAARMSAPSSVGLTFTVDPRLADAVTFHPAAASYTPDRPRDPFGEEAAEAPPRKWSRVPTAASPVEVRLGDADGAPRRHVLVPDALELYLIPRRPDENGLVTITAALVNLRTAPPEEDRDVAAWFQVGLTATTAEPAIVDRRIGHVVPPRDPDLRSGALLYRDQLSFGAGHGCAVAWGDEVDGAVREVRTEFVPRAEVPRAAPAETDADLSLETLSQGEADQVLGELDRLCDQYEAWIGERERGVAQGTGRDRVAEPLQGIAGEHLDAARRALTRMRAGITLLRSDEQAFTAFQLANRAMHLQRARQDWVRGGRSEAFTLTDQRWRPFQIAFVLINLPSLTDRHSPEREIADLLWFPAGGGKTEAYLALIAYLVVIRRLRDPLVEGTAVIMRYTLRLLTLQQFERAAMLMCSLERVRLETGDLGDRAFGIGLWVGAASTPNTVAAAKRNLAKSRKGNEVEEGNPMQLKACPWCGTPLGVDEYVVTTNPGALMVRCADAECAFRGGLPVHVVDEDVYRVRPELVIGTVDKFARMAWDGQIAALFGRTDPRDIGPDLIIQDELHLISGPLGSTVGLFESAVDLAAGRREPDGTATRPKLVASTATIRRADGQVKAVFDRESELFPPPGLNPDESFFAAPGDRLELGARQYLGVMAPGTSHATLMVRAYASLLDTVAAAEDVPDEIRDAYWTLVGYFNSLRVLGSAYLQVTDDVASRLALLATRRGEDRARRVELEELTSRRSSSEIPVTLKRLETGLASGGTPLDVVLATNMISVGLDVDRLGLMAVMGQPPSSAEYIQATSRVGRKFPGLVVAIFNAAKSRDRSHYEGFADFHGSLYRAVEATSATPFADRSRDRGLHAAYVAAVRMTVPALRPDDAAAAYDPTLPEVKAVQDAVLERVQRVADSVTYSGAKKDIARLSASWHDSARSQDGVRQYANRRDTSRALLIDATQALTTEAAPRSATVSLPWPTPQSMRDVDAETNLFPARMSSRQDEN